MEYSKFKHISGALQIENIVPRRDNDRSKQSNKDIVKSQIKSIEKSLIKFWNYDPILFSKINETQSSLVYWNTRIATLKLNQLKYYLQTGMNLYLYNLLKYAKNTHPHAFDDLKQQKNFYGGYDLYTTAARALNVPGIYILQWMGILPSENETWLFKASILSLASFISINSTLTPHIRKIYEALHIQDNRNTAFGISKYVDVTGSDSTYSETEIEECIKLNRSLKSEFADLFYNFEDLLDAGVPLDFVNLSGRMYPLERIINQTVNYTDINSDLKLIASAYKKKKIPMSVSEILKWQFPDGATILTLIAFGNSKIEYKVDTIRKMVAKGASLDDPIFFLNKETSVRDVLTDIISKEINVSNDEYEKFYKLNDLIKTL